MVKSVDLKLFPNCQNNEKKLASCMFSAIATFNIDPAMDPKELELKISRTLYYFDVFIRTDFLKSSEQFVFFEDLGF